MSEEPYEVILFDLDHTLWDHHTNAKESLSEIFSKYLPITKDNSLQEMIDTFKSINDVLWSDYHLGKITQYSIRTERFTRFLNYFNLSDDSLAEKLSIEYTEKAPKKKNLLPGTKEVLNYLNDSYSMIIVTNGFEQTQRIKILHSEIGHFFDAVITSEKAGIKKPSPEIFYHALESTGNARKKAIMVGDNLETDIAGARAAGIDTVHFNPDDQRLDPKATYTINHLLELKNIL